MCALTTFTFCIQLGFGHLPVCVDKTFLSFTHEQKSKTKEKLLMPAQIYAHIHNACLFNLLTIKS